jgi:creatinine amidohydrolase
MRTALFCLLFPMLASAQLSTRWDELTAGDFVTALDRAQNTCLLPFGILEKHGPQLPLGTDLLNVRWAALKAATQEYTIVFPEYYFGQIFEARHEPGTIAYSSKLQLDLLRETTSEMARNGCKKIVIVNGHGGNNSLLPYFAQSQLESKKDFVVYIHQRGAYPPGRPKLKSTTDSHAGESETAHTMVTHPELVHQERSGAESGADRNRLDLPKNLYTGIWWYAKFPDHYAGDGAAATKELGEFDMNAWVADIANTIRAVKSDKVSQRLQDEFFGLAEKPRETRQ